jgi:hypothetical protein
MKGTLSSFISSYYPLFEFISSLLPYCLLFYLPSYQCRLLRPLSVLNRSSLRMKCDGTRAEIRFRHSSKLTSQFKSAGASVHSSAGSRVVQINGSNAGYSNFRGSVKGTGYPLHSPLSPSLPLPCVTVCHHVSTELYRHVSNSVLNYLPCYLQVITVLFSRTAQIAVSGSRRSTPGPREPLPAR